MPSSRTPLVHPSSNGRALRPLRSPGAPPNRETQTLRALAHEACSGGEVGHRLGSVRSVHKGREIIRPLPHHSGAVLQTRQHAPSNFGARSPGCAVRLRGWRRAGGKSGAGLVSARSGPAPSQSASPTRRGRTGGRTSAVTDVKSNHSRRGQTYGTSWCCRRPTPKCCPQSAPRPESCTRCGSRSAGAGALHRRPWPRARQRRPDADGARARFVPAFAQPDIVPVNEGN